MKANDLLHTLQVLGRRRRWCVAEATLRGFFPEPDNTFRTAMSRHVRRGLLQRLSPGLYLNPYAPPPALALEALAGYLRPNDAFYVSLESALHEQGWMSQIPNRLTLMTDGPRYTYTTPLGIIEFTHTARDRAAWRPRVHLNLASKLYVASPELALKDLKHVGRNLDLVEVPDNDSPGEP